MEAGKTPRLSSGKSKVSLQREGHHSVHMTQSMASCVLLLEKTWALAKRFINVTLNVTTCDWPPMKVLLALFWQQKMSPKSLPMNQ